MQRTLAHFAVLVSLATVAACGGKTFDSDGSNTDPKSDGGIDATPDASHSDSGGQCTTPSSAPACCMSFGGWSENGDPSSACDNLPDPSAPGWKLVDDAHGCPVWTPPPNAPIGCNGKPPPPPTATCCPIDDAPSCCMHYGGTETNVGSCGTICDGMPGPGYPGWEKRVDSNGCPYWYSPPDVPAEQKCGAAVIDAGPTDPPPPSADAGIGVSIDAAGPPHN